MQGRLRKGHARGNVKDHGGVVGMGTVAQKKTNAEGGGGVGEGGGEDGVGELKARYSVPTCTQNVALEDAPIFTLCGQ